MGQLRHLKKTHSSEASSDDASATTSARPVSGQFFYLPSEVTLKMREGSGDDLDDSSVDAF